MRTGHLPDLFTYLSFRKYLEDWFSARKAADSRFSHRLFMRRAGATSPSLFGEVVSGKRNLSPAMVEGFVRALGLQASAAAFFRDLVIFDQAPSDAERNAAWERIAAHRRFRTARSIEGASFTYLSSWVLPATRELALRRDFQADPEWVARMLLPAVPVAVAREALDVLFALGLLQEQQGRVVPADVSVVTPHQVHGLAVHNYHRQMLERAQAAIETVRSSERHLKGVTVAVPERIVPLLKAELDAVQERLLHLCDEHASEAERVYQIELCLFPLSRATQRRAGESS